MVSLVVVVDELGPFRSAGSDEAPHIEITVFL